jgi:hypothetical protein
MEFIKGDTRRMKAAARYGRFMVNLFNPQDVHVRYSNVMVEAVLLCQSKTALEVRQEWGDAAKALDGLIDKGKVTQAVTLYDYWDYEARCVWVVPAEKPVGANAGGVDSNIVILPPTENKLPFLPWAVRVGGSTLERYQKDKRHPLLYSVYTAGQWDTLNIVKSLVMGKAIALSGQSAVKEEGNNPDTTSIDWTEPGGVAKVPAGNTLNTMIPAPIDPKLLEIENDLRSAVSKSTISSILSSPDIPSGAAFSAINLVTQTAVGALKPYKELGEGEIADILGLMLQWVEFTGEPLVSYGRGREQKDLLNGDEFAIQPDEIDPEALYITVELTPDVPTDRIQRVNAAVMSVQNLGMSRERSLEEIGVNDPAKEMKQAYLERLMENKINLMIQEEQMRLQLMTQQAQMQMQAQIQQQQIQDQQNAQAELERQQAQNMMGPQGIPGAEGQGVNPAMGGMPAQQMMPQATREQQTGAARNGAPVAEGGV